MKLNVSLPTRWFHTILLIHLYMTDVFLSQTQGKHYLRMHSCFTVVTKELQGQSKQTFTSQMKHFHPTSSLKKKVVVSQSGTG